MAFFRNFSNGIISRSVLDEKEEQQNSAVFRSSVMNEDVDGTYSGRGFDINMDGQYQSNAEPVCGGRLQNGATADNVVGLVDSHLQPSGRTGAAGKWGSTFWKDCQPMEQRGSSDSGQESKSDYKDGDCSEDNFSDDRIDRVESEYEEAQKEADRSQRGQGDVPADEMLSDEYYEQDEENQSDPIYYRGYSCPMNFRPPLEPAAANNSKSRGLRAMNNNVDDDDDDYGNNDDADADYEEEEEEDEDDPEDADFEPDDVFLGANARKKQDQDWEGSEEDDDSDEDIDVSDEDDYYDTKKPKVRQQIKGVRKSSGCERKSFQASSRQRKKVSYEEDYLAEDSDNENDEDFKSMTRRGTALRKANGKSTNNWGQSSEVRTSTRSVRKVSYVESEDSEDIDDGKKKKTQKDDVEEEDGDVIEKVLWHQPKGTAEDACRNNKSTEPVLLSQLFDAEPDWNEMEFLIKWKGQSHLHCQWKSLVDLQNLSGFKKVLNYTKKVMEDIRYRRMLSREEVIFE